MQTDVMFSSKTGQWDTEQRVIDDLATVFTWDLDTCADRPNVCDNYYDKARNALMQDWKGLCWMNPPYGRQIGKWLEKARLESELAHCRAVVCLVPARTDTKWWHDNVPYASQVVFIKGRFKFGSDEHWVNHWVNKGYELFKYVGRQSLKLYRPDVLTALNWSVVPASWSNSSHIRKDSAPFPSAFVVFGNITMAQSLKLESYGWSLLLSNYTIRQS